ncbi:hypothetical protein LUW75_13955 [Streptomyces sp. MRC013]|uniref:hypothetical protein n=1 Tax=Streptomyces sp. MRC013 TaxID=2898276 RepID=UPI002026E300|nr:hypothetical protein [Streptomyces sp. MRC013]URM92715.1 hypothetical protein LUW75_13955 [Streptomyces sp. MRC013]
MKERLRAAEEAVARLRGELLKAGVVLPSLRVDLVTTTSEVPYPLVELGRCNLDTAARLAAALEGARK